MASLHSYGVLDTEREPDFDDLVKIAAEVCGTPIAVVSLVDTRRQFFKAELGLGVREMPLEISFCAHAILAGDLLVVPDATKDPRLSRNPLVTGEPNLRFYAGVVLKTPEGLPIGTMCVLDYQPRELGEHQIRTLRLLARQAMIQLELRRSVAERDRALDELRAIEARHRQIVDSAIDFAIITMDLAGMVTSWNVGAERILGWSAAEICGKAADVFFLEEDIADGVPLAEMTTAREKGRGNDERWHRRKDGIRFWASGEMMPLLDDEARHIGYLKILRDRTARRIADEKQRDDAEFLSGVLAASDDAIAVLDLDAALVFMSEGGQRAMAVSDFDAICGRPWPGLWQDESADDARAALDVARAGGRGQFQGRADTLAGMPKWWDVQVTAILGVDGVPEKLLTVSRDITSRRQAEEALREAEALNTLILDSSRDCIVVLDLEGHTRFVNAGGIEAMEIDDVESIIGLSWLRVWKDADNDAARAAVNEARAGRFGRFQGFCQTHKGTPKWWDVVISPLFGPAGVPDRLVSVGRDITERMETEQRLALSQEQLSLALGASGMVGIWDWDLKADLIFADTNFARIYNVDPDRAAKGAPPAEYLKSFHPSDRPAFEAELQRLLAGADEFSCEYRILQVDGSMRWILARGRLVRDVDGKPDRFPGASVDITELKLAEEQRIELTRELSHRMKNTLAMVQAIATQTFRQVKTVEEGRDAISGRLTALARAQDILTQSSWVTAEIRDVVEGALVPHRTGEGRFGITGPHVELTAQQGLGLSLALHELGTNAAKYGALSDENGRIDIGWTVSPSGNFHFEWVESGGPPVETPKARGFGSRLVERIVAPYFDGSAKLDFEPAGVAFRLDGQVAEADQRRQGDL